MQRRLGRAGGMGTGRRGGGGASGVPDTFEVVAVQPVPDSPPAVVVGFGAASGTQVENLGGPQAAEVSDDDQGSCCQPQREVLRLVVADAVEPRRAVHGAGDGDAQRGGTGDGKPCTADRVAGLDQAGAGDAGQVGTGG